MRHCRAACAFDWICHGALRPLYKRVLAFTVERRARSAYYYRKSVVTARRRTITPLECRWASLLESRFLRIPAADSRFARRISIRRDSRYRRLASLARLTSKFLVKNNDSIGCQLSQPLLYPLCLRTSWISVSHCCYRQQFMVPLKGRISRCSGNIELEL